MLLCNNGPQVTPDILSNTVFWFNGGQIYPPGQYSVGYITGSMMLQASDGWSAAGYHIVDDAGHDVVIPNNGLRYGSQAACATANVGYCANFNHSVAGKIGVYLLDALYSDNVAGTPDPTYMLCSGFGTCQAGDVVTGAPQNLTVAVVYS